MAKLARAPSFCSYAATIFYFECMYLLLIYIGMLIVYNLLLVDPYSHVCG